MMQEKFSWIAWLPQEIHDLSTSIHKVIHINPQGYPHKSQAVGEKPVVNIRLLAHQTQKKRTIHC